MKQPVDRRSGFSLSNSLLLFISFIAVIALLVVLLADSVKQSRSSWYDYEVIHVYPHDSEAFTQGLLFRDGFLYESTGRKGHSRLRKVRLDDGAILQEQKIDATYFAEGLTDWQDSLVQLTWKAGKGFVYDLDTFVRQRTFTYPGQGWGLARYKDRLVMSDGTAVLRFLDPETLLETNRITVTEAGEPVKMLNELEMVQGRLYANIWKADEIVMIDPDSGSVTGRLDLGGLLNLRERYLGSADVLNGIAYDAAGDRLLVTGKLWPYVFEIRIHPRQAD